ncbi:MAG: hypothetical protein BGO30_05525 [Bacteroidetes bacterium 41-46]|jgi:signal transduction histidine kinase|nr:MAG: hypothetical protein BGO30_05525 [Bacteroidetes bacterium 41-46]
MVRFKFEYAVILIYLLVGSGWILFSDELTLLLAPTPEIAAHFQTYKGLFYVFITGVLLYFFLRKHLQKLRNAEEKALESDRLKSGFLANVSHEIRTPMNGVIGFAELLKDESLSNEERLHYISIIEKSGERMLELIGDIVDISMADSGQVKIKLSQVNIIELLGSLTMLFSPSAEEKKIELIVSPCKESERVTEIVIDREKVVCVLSKIIKNAIKYTNSGYVRVGCHRDGGYIYFEVADSGVGIPDGQFDKIFNRFVQVNMSYTKTYDGAGLGLSIAKSYVEMMGGKIWAQPNPDGGSVFIFTVPFKPVSPSRRKNDKKS